MKFLYSTICLSVFSSATWAASIGSSYTAISGEEEALVPLASLRSFDSFPLSQSSLPESLSLDQIYVPAPSHSQFPVELDPRDVWSLTSGADTDTQDAERVRETQELLADLSPAIGLLPGAGGAIPEDGLGIRMVRNLSQLSSAPSNRLQSAPSFASGSLAASQASGFSLNESQLPRTGIGEYSGLDSLSSTLAPESSLDPVASNVDAESSLPIPMAVPTSDTAVTLPISLSPETHKPSTASLIE